MRLECRSEKCQEIFQGEVETVMLLQIIEKNLMRMVTLDRPLIGVKQVGKCQEFEIRVKNINLFSTTQMMKFLDQWNIWISVGMLEPQVLSSLIFIY